MALPEVKATTDDLEGHLDRLWRITSLTKGLGEMSLAQERMREALESQRQPGTIVIAPEGTEFIVRFMRHTAMVGGYLDGDNSHEATGLINAEERPIDRDTFRFHAGRLEADGSMVIAVSHDLSTACVVEELGNEHRPFIQSSLSMAVSVVPLEK